jgi:hypothetical protein
MEPSKNQIATLSGVGASSGVPQLRRNVDKAGVLRGGLIAYSLRNFQGHHQI